MTEAVFTPIGHVETTHADLADTPSQASESVSLARIVVDARFADGLLGLERYEFLWVLTWLDRAPPDHPLRVVPRATQATGEVQGVFASRFPFRPNPLGLSLVRQLSIEGTVVTVHGADLLDRTPVLDIKPWFADCDDPQRLRRHTAS